MRTLLALILLAPITLAGAAPPDAALPGTLVAFWPFENADEWEASGPGAATIVDFDGGASRVLHVEGGPGFEVRSRALDFPVDAQITIHARWALGIHQPDVLVLVDEDGADALIMRASGNSFSVSTGTTPSGTIIWRSFSVPIFGSWHRLDVLLGANGQATVRVDETHAREVSLLTQSPVERLAIRPNGATGWVDFARVHSGPAPADADFSRLPAGWTLETTHLGSADLLPSFSMRSQHALTINGSALPFGRSQASFPTEDLGELYLLQGAAKPHSPLPPESHSAALAALDDDGGVVWAVTVGPYPGADAGLWLWAPESNIPLQPLPFGSQHSQGWLVAWVRVDVETQLIAVHPNGEPGVELRVPNLASTARIAVGDVWSTTGLGAGKTYHDLVMAAPLAPGVFEQ